MFTANYNEILPQMRHAKKILFRFIGSNVKKLQMNASLHLCLVISFQEKKANKINSNKLD